MRLVVAGYLIRYPIGGYAWQAAHYVLGLRRLGHDVWFYEDTGYYTPAYNPVTHEYGPVYDYGLRAAGDFLERIGFGEQWVFVEVASGGQYGPGAGRADALFREADLLINLGGVNRIPPERRAGRPAIYIDLDPGYTQLRVAGGDREVRAILDEHDTIFTFGENIGTPRSSIPAGGYTWHPTRQPVLVDLWANAGPPGGSYTTVGRWDTSERNLNYAGETYHWSKRTEWLNFLDLPTRADVGFEIAMNVTPADRGQLVAHRWRLVDPVAVSADPWRYRPTSASPAASSRWRRT